MIYFLKALFGFNSVVQCNVIVLVEERCPATEQCADELEGGTEG